MGRSELIEALAQCKMERNLVQMHVPICFNAVHLLNRMAREIEGQLGMAKPEPKPIDPSTG